MDAIYEKKNYSHYPANLILCMKILKYFDNIIFLAGSASLTSQIYFGDYDLLSLIKKKGTPKSSYREFQRILKQSEEQDFLKLDEIKIQLKDGTKYREFLDEDKFIKIFNDIDIVKFDFILFSDGIYYELSSIYAFQYQNFSKETQMKSLYDELPELKKEGKYYKILKRIFAISSLDKNITLAQELTRFFNENGKDYRILSNLEAIEKIFKISKDEKVKNRIIDNMRILNIDSKDIPKKINSIKKSLKKKAEDFYNKNLKKDFPIK